LEEIWLTRENIRVHVERKFNAAFMNPRKSSRMHESSVNLRVRVHCFRHAPFRHAARTPAPPKVAHGIAADRTRRTSGNRDGQHGAPRGSEGRQCGARITARIPEEGEGYRVRQREENEIKYENTENVIFERSNPI
jgi:hypothetical protein